MAGPRGVPVPTMLRCGGYHGPMASVLSRSVGFAVLLLCAGTATAQVPVDGRQPVGPLREAPWPFGLGKAPASFEASARRPLFMLGRRLFFDPILSSDRTVSCGSCHQPDHGFASPQALPPGVAGKRALRNAPTLYNRVLGTLHSWDGRARSLEEQVVMPISNPNEMGLPVEEALKRLAGDGAYESAFREVFGRAADQRGLADALASFVRRLTIGDSPVDHFQGARDRTLLTFEERAGLWLYESKGRCWTCHSGPNFTDEAFHNTGIGVVDGVPLPGRMAVTGREADRGAFRTPTLRGLLETAPYMHDGSLRSLEDVVAFYRRGGNRNPGLDGDLRPLDLTDTEAGHLVAFLRALSRRVVE